MNKKKPLLILLTVLCVITAGLAFSHFATRTKVPEGAVMVIEQGKERFITGDKLKLVQVSGTIVNGKGETSEVNSKGICLGDLTGVSYQTVKVSADDEFSAEVAADEINNAFLLFEEKGARLVVFGDKNSKRAVRNVAKVEYN